MLAGLIMGGSAIVVALAFERMGSVHSLETQEAVQKFLNEPPGSDLGIDVQSMLTMLRTLTMVAAGCATAAAILGYQVLRRSRSARLWLTVIAVPLFVTGLVTGGFVSSLVAASTVLLWLQPARDWFDGVTRPQADARRAAAAPPPAQTPMPPAAGSQPGAAPGPWPTPYGQGTPGATPPAWGAPTTSPYDATPPVARPGVIVWACILTWICSSLVALGMIASAVALAASPDLLFDELHRQNPELAEEGISDGFITTVTYLMVAAVVAWCVGAAVLAWLVFRRVAWARIVLVVSCATCAALSLVGTLVGGIILVVPLAASVLTMTLLLRPDSRPWFAQSRR